MKRRIMTLAGAFALATSPLSSQAFAQASKPVAAMQFVTEQGASEWLAGMFIGQAVQNTAGETVGDINDLVFNHQGRIITVVLGVGGFLGMGEKNVGVRYESLSFKVGSKGERVIVVAVSKDALAKAVAFKTTEKTTFERVKAKAADLTDQATKKVEDMTKSAPAK